MNRTQVFWLIIAALAGVSFVAISFVELVFTSKP